MVSDNKSAAAECMILRYMNLCVRKLTLMMNLFYMSKMIINCILDKVFQKRNIDTHFKHFYFIIISV